MVDLTWPTMLPRLSLPPVPVPQKLKVNFS